MTTYGQMRSLARRLEKTNASSLPGRMPRLPMAASRVATEASSTNRPIWPVSEKSSIAARKVALATMSSSFAAMTARPAPSSVPPTQKPSAFTLSVLAISRATRSGVKMPSSR